MVKPWWFGALVLLLASACSSAPASVVCRQPVVPKVEAVVASKMVALTASDTVYTLSATGLMGESVGVFSGPDLKSPVDNRVPPCSVFVVSDEATNADGVEVAHVLRVVEWQGKYRAYWGLSGYLPREYLTIAKLD